MNNLMGTGPEDGSDNAALNQNMAEPPFSYHSQADEEAIPGQLIGSSVVKTVRNLKRMR